MYIQHVGEIKFDTISKHHRKKGDEQTTSERYYKTTQNSNMTHTKLGRKTFLLKRQRASCKSTGHRSFYTATHRKVSEGTASKWAKGMSWEAVGKKRQSVWKKSGVTDK